MIIQDSSRKVAQITGQDAAKFLQDLTTNDVGKVSDGLVYSALLTPQGKLIFDFFLAKNEQGYLIDIDAQIADQAIARLTLYKLRADVEIVPTDLSVERSLEPMEGTSFQDPRHVDMGYRRYVETSDAPSEGIDFTAQRIGAGVPKLGMELRPNESFILELGFERLSGVDFKKGCYVGQEVTARMKHKTELRKGLARVKLAGAVEMGADILGNGKVVGQVYSQANGTALAYIRFDRITDDMHANDVAVTDPEPIS